MLLGLMEEHQTLSNSINKQVEVVEESHCEAGEDRGRAGECALSVSANSILSQLSSLLHSSSLFASFLLMMLMPLEWESRSPNLLCLETFSSYPLHSGNAQPTTGSDVLNIRESSVGISQRSLFKCQNVTQEGSSLDIGTQQCMSFSA